MALVQGGQKGLETQIQGQKGVFTDYQGCVLKVIEYRVKYIEHLVFHDLIWSPAHFIIRFLQYIHQFLLTHVLYGSKFVDIEAVGFEWLSEKVGEFGRIDEFKGRVSIVQVGV